MPEEMPLEMAEIPQDSKTYSVVEILEKAAKISKLAYSKTQHLKKVIKGYRDLLARRPGRTSLIKHDIELTEEQPIQAKPYRLAPKQKEIIGKGIKKMLDFNIIEPGESDFTSPIWRSTYGFTGFTW